MPSYDYECLLCGKVVERFMSMASAEDQLSGDCLDENEIKICTFRKIIGSAPEFRLRGKGWYETDGKDSATGSNQRRLA